MEKAKPQHEAIEQSVHVDCTPEEAFKLFTERLAEWWPFAENCQLEPWSGGSLIETTPGGEEIYLGSITDWDPPHRIAFTWHPDPRCDDDQSLPDQFISVDFLVEADGTRVTLTHYNWHLAGVETCVARFSACAAQAFAVA
jgi:uncharacterized protein YndB with AHSA1/START domain